MKRASYVISIPVALVVALGACRGSSRGIGPTPTDQGPFDLILEGDASFHTPHGDESISVAVLTFTGVLVALEQGLVSASADPAFSFTFTNLLVDGILYEVHYWIDSNVGGGAPGVCNLPAIDHQWSMPFPSLEDVTITQVHDDSDNDPVCSTFD